MLNFKGLTLETYINEEIHADHINKENTIISKFAIMKYVYLMLN